MRIPVRLAWVAVLAAAVAAQVSPPPHHAGLLVAGDYDADGVDDVLVIPPNHPARIYRGSKVFPHLVAGPKVALPTPFPSDLPVFAGGHLYVPTTRSTMGKGYLHVYRPGRRGLLPHRVVQLDELDPTSVVNSVRLARLDRDLNGDGGNDVLVVWGEEPLSDRGAFHAAWVSPRGVERRIDLPPIPGQPRISYVTGVHRTVGIGGRSAYVATLSGLDGPGFPGFGLRAVLDGPRAGGGLWFRGAPPLQYQGGVPAAPVSAYGAFQPVPGLGTPLLRLAVGESILLRPWPVAPWVQAQGEIVYTTRHGISLPSCAADYDGDGRTEMVFCEPLLSPGASFVVVADPGGGRAYIQGFDLSHDLGGIGLVPYFGARGDFDGDGDPDLLLSCISLGTQAGYWVMLQNRRTRPGRPPLVRLY